MTLQEAEKIVQEFASALASERATDGPASCLSHLPHAPETILQGMKLWLAHDIQHRSLTQEFRNEIATVASRLPFFVEDGEAGRINAASHDFLPPDRAKLSTEDIVARAQAVGRVHEWATDAYLKGSLLRRDLADFIVTVEQFDLADPLFWRRVYALAGLEYPPERNRLRAIPFG